MFTSKLIFLQFLKDAEESNVAFEEFYDVDTPAAKSLVDFWPKEGLIVENQLVYARSVQRVVNYEYLDENVVDVMLHQLQRRTSSLNEVHHARNHFVSILLTS